MGPQPTIRSITREELSLPLQWAADEGWNPGLEDAEPFHAADPNGFLMAFRGSRSAASRSSATASGSSVSHRPARAPRKAAASACVCGGPAWPLDGCVVGLDGVVAQQANYARSGFALAHRNVRYAGRPMTETAARALA